MWKEVWCWSFSLMKEGLEKIAMKFSLQNFLKLFHKGMRRFDCSSTHGTRRNVCLQNLQVPGIWKRPGPNQDLCLCTCSGAYCLPAPQFHLSPVVFSLHGWGNEKVKMLEAAIIFPIFPTRFRGRMHIPWLPHPTPPQLCFHNWMEDQPTCPFLFRSQNIRSWRASPHRDLRA